MFMTLGSLAGLLRRPALAPSLRVAAGFIALALVVGLTGCDGNGPSGLVTGPTVQFGTSAATVVEGDTIRIPVTLEGGTGQAVTVEVLYARGASSASDIVTAEDSVDFSGFGTPGAAVSTETVTFSGAAEETQEITIIASEDSFLEEAEQVILALQNAQGATIATPREFTLTIGVRPLADIRLLPNDEIVTVEGIVTRAEGRVTYIQDATAGIALFSPSGTDFYNAVASGAIAPGDRIQVVGSLTDFQPTTGVFNTGFREVQFISDFAVLSRGNPLPAPQNATIAQITAGDPDTEAYESEIVRITNLTIDPAGDVVFQTARNYNVTQTVGGVTSTMVLRVPSAGDTELFGVVIPLEPFTFEGPVGQFRGGNQLSPVEATDVRVP
jgi:predicted extracellular nuclease